MVGTVSDDVRVYEVPALKVCALDLLKLGGFPLRRRALNASLSISWHLRVFFEIINCYNRRLDLKFFFMIMIIASCDYFFLMKKHL